MARFHSFVLHGLVLFLLTRLSTPRSIILLDESSPDRQLQDETTPPTVTLFPVVEPITDGVEAQEALEDALALWNTSGLVAYQLGFRRVCECTEEYLAPSISTVENGVVVEVLVGNGTLLDSDSLLFQNAYSVEVLFGILESALEEGIYYEIRVDYDATYGYPTSVYIDYDFNMADEEFNVVIDSFQLLDHGNDGNETSSSTSSPTKGAQEALEEAMARWEVFTNRENRYCTLITSDDVLMKKKNLTSVEDFFVRIQKALDDEADVIRVDYDVTMGYPISVDIDYNVNVKGEDEDVSAEIVVILEGQEGDFFTCDTPELLLSGSGVSTPRRLVPSIASLRLLSVATLLMITMSMA